MTPTPHKVRLLNLPYRKNIDSLSIVFPIYGLCHPIGTMIGCVYSIMIEWNGRLTLRVMKSPYWRRLRRRPSEVALRFPR